MEIKNAGLNLGILTSNSKENVRKFLIKNNLNLIFDFIYSSNNLFGKDKAIKQILNHEKISKKNVIYVGDETRDAEASKKAGIPFTAVTWGLTSGKNFEYFALEKDYEAEELSSGILYPIEGTSFKRVVETGLPMVISDTAESETFLDQKLLKEGIRSSLVYPLEYKGRIIGTLNFGSKEPGHFSEKDRISSRGYAYGYTGGGLQFAAALILVGCHDQFGLTEAGAARIGMLSAALWWGGFALVTLRYLREPRVAQGLTRGAAPGATALLILGVSRVWKTLLQVGKLKHLLLFLLAFLVYNEGIQTVIDMATINGKQELRLSATALMITLLLVQVVGIFGALLFSRIAARTGTKRAVMLSLVVWSAVVIYAYFIQTASQYFILGGVVGLVLGGSISW